MKHKYSDYIYETLGLSKRLYDKCIDLAVEKEKCILHKTSMSQCQEEVIALNHCMQSKTKAASHYYFTNAYANDPKRAEAEGLSKSFEKRASYPR